MEHKSWHKQVGLALEQDPTNKFFKELKFHIINRAAI